MDALDRESKIIGIRKMLRSVQTPPAKVFGLEDTLTKSSDEALALTYDVLFETMQALLEAAANEKKRRRK